LTHQPRNFTGAANVLNAVEINEAKVTVEPAAQVAPPSSA
jgi:hypothetical protein